MNSSKRSMLALLLTGLWINISETIRWELLVKAYWVDFFDSFGHVLPEQAINLVIWVIWGFSVALVIYVLSRKFSLIHTTLLAWCALFVLLWLVLWNLGILPITILAIVIPWSFVEVFVAAWICKKLLPQENT